MAPPDSVGLAARGGVRPLPLVMLVVLGLAYGLTFSLNRIATTHGIPFLAYVFWMGLGAALVTLGLSLAFGGPPQLKAAHLKAYAVTGVLSFGVPYTVLAFVAPKVPAGVLSMVVTLTPVIAYVLAVAVRLEPLWWVKFLGLLFGLAGVALIVVPETSLPSRDMVWWILLALLAPLGYATSSIAVALMRPPESASLALTSGLLFAGTLFVGIVMAASRQWWWFSGPMDAGDWALIAVTLVTVIGFFLFIELIRQAGPVFFTTVNFITPLTGIGWGILFFSETHSAYIWGALVLLFAGVFFVILRPRPVS